VKDKCGIVLPTCLSYLISQYQLPMLPCSARGNLLTQMLSFFKTANGRTMHARVLDRASKSDAAKAEKEKERLKALKRKKRPCFAFQRGECKNGDRFVKS
jgi:hypothetical protein